MDLVGGGGASRYSVEQLKHARKIAGLYKERYGADLQAVVVFGNAASGSLRAGKAEFQRAISKDLDLLVVLKGGGKPPFSHKLFADIAPGGKFQVNHHVVSGDVLKLLNSPLPRKSNLRLRSALRGVFASPTVALDGAGLVEKLKAAARKTSKKELASLVGHSQTELKHLRDKIGQRADSLEEVPANRWTPELQAYYLKVSRSLFAATDFLEAMEKGGLAGLLRKRKYHVPEVLRHEISGIALKDVAEHFHESPLVRPKAPAPNVSRIDKYRRRR